MSSVECGFNEIAVIIDKLKKIILDKDIIVLLQGDLASGKTTLVKAYVESLGIKDGVTSPTFSLQSRYGDKIYHYDVYNITLDEFLSLGLLEELDKKGVHFVEWGGEDLEKLLNDVGMDNIKVKIAIKDDKREYEINA